LICPRCGFEQPDETECARCGVVFSRYRGPVFYSGTSPAPTALEAAAPAGEVRDEPADGAPSDGPISLEADRRISAGPYGATPAPAASGGSAFRSGPILAESFSIYRANFLPFLLISLVAHSPRILFGVLAPLALTRVSPGLPFFRLIDLLASIVSPQLATAAVTYGVYQQLRGHETSVGDSLRVGLSALGRVFVVAILNGIGIGIGFLFCIVPGVLLALRWAVTVPVAVEEKRSGFGALRRSTELTDGYRREIFSILFVVGLISLGLQIALQLALASRGALAVNAGGIGAALLTTGLTASAAAVMYYRLRSAKESIDVQELASIFD